MEPLIHLSYMGTGSSCNPTRRTHLTNDLSKVTCGSCKATKYYKKLRDQQLCEHNETLMIEDDQFECMDCGKIISLEEMKRIIEERN